MFRLFYEFTESLRIAFSQIRANKMRAGLTALGVVIGIVAVTLMFTAILGINRGFEKSFEGFGSNVLYVSERPLWGNVDWWEYRNRPDIRPEEYGPRISAYIAENPDSALKLCVPVDDTGRTMVERAGLRLNGIYTVATNQNFPLLSKSDMLEGRFFNQFEVEQASNVVMIGFDIADALFPNGSATGQTIMIDRYPYTVIGVAERQGSFLGGFSWDSLVAMPLTTWRHNGSARDRGELRIQYESGRALEAREELHGLMRIVRGLEPDENDNFALNESDALRAQIEPIKQTIATAGLVITGLALFVGAIGIMNITYVSVKERTREIGTRKALGARRRTILMQFLIEAVSICLLGGLVGLAMTWSLGALVTVMAPSFPIVFSPVVVVVSMVLSTVVGVLSGFFPALSASSLDPVEALRFE